MQWTVFLLLITAVVAFRNPYPKAVKHELVGDAAGDRLLLTPYLKSGNAKTARDLALVTGLQPNITSYSGFFTVNEECGSNLYFWFFPSQNKPDTDPVSVWLQGGPGSTSFYGLLTENGPYNLKIDDGTLELREYSWNKNASVIYIDNPVGTGYSYTTGGCYANDETQVGQDLLSAFEQFFQLFPELSGNEFYLTGESYAGKYVPAAAYAIYKSNSSINLKGIMIGNGLIDSRNQQDYSSYVYQLGFVDDAVKQVMAEKEQETRDVIDSGDFVEGSDLMNEILYIFEVNSGIRSLYNYLYAYGEPEADIDAFVTQTSVRQALHIGNATWNDGGEVYDHLSADVSKSVKPWLEELLEVYRVLLYNGQLDIICAYPLTIDFVRLLNWSRTDEYLSAPRRIWTVGDRLAGYSKSAGNFTEVLVRSAGHMVPTDQPEWAQDLFNKFIFNQKIGTKVFNEKKKKHYS